MAQGSDAQIIAPSRRALLEWHQLTYQFGNTPASDALLQSLPPEQSRASLLLLGCGDPRHLLASVGCTTHLHGGGRGTGLAQLHVVLNDVVPHVLARTALLLLLARELDADSADDMDVLWDVWHNAVWLQGTWARVRPFVQRLLDGGVEWLSCGRAEDREALGRIWAEWLGHAGRGSGAGAAAPLPTPEQLLRMRDEWRARGLGAIFAPKGSTVTEAVSQLPQMDKARALLLVTEALTFDAYNATTDARRGERGSGVRAQVEADILQWSKAGSLHPPGKPLARDVNVTLLDPGTRKWRVHYDSQACKCWEPFSLEDWDAAARQVASGGDAARPPAGAVLRQACVTRMTAVVSAFQQRLRGASSSSSTPGQALPALQLSVQLFAMDGLLLCAGQEMQRPAPPASASASSSASSTSSPLLFDVIDTSNVGDHVHLLPLLVVAAPRLARHPHARLRTQTMTWGASADTVEGYLAQCLGFSAKLSSTLLGLRLVSDLQAGGTSPISIAQSARTLFSVAYTLLWAPADPLALLGIPRASSTPQPTPPLLRPTLRLAELRAAGDGKPWCSVSAPVTATHEGASLERATCALAAVCCRRFFYHRDELSKSSKAGLESATPHALAWLLANVLCQGRADASSLLSAGQEGDAAAPASLAVLGSLSATEQLRVLGALREQVGALLPGEFRLCFQAGVDLLRGSLQQHLASEGTSPANGEERVEVEEWTGELPLLGGLELLGASHTPPLRLLLVAASEAPPGTDDVLRCMRAGASRADRHAASTSAATMRAFQWWSETCTWALRGETPYTGRTRHVVDVMQAACVPLPGTGPDGGLSSATTKALKVTFHTPAGALGSTSPPGHDFYVLALSIQLDVVIGAPVRLSGFSCARKRPPPALARCLLQLPGGQQQGGGSAKQAVAAVPSGSAAWALQLAGPVTETAEAYQLHLQLTSAAGGGDSSGGASPSGLKVTLPRGINPEAGKAGHKCCPSSHVVRVALDQPAGVAPLELLLGWPVAAGLGEPDEAVAACRYSSGSGVRALLRRKAARVELTLRKAEAWERWPADLALQGPPVMVASAARPSSASTSTSSGGGGKKKGSKARAGGSSAAVSAGAGPSTAAAAAISPFWLRPGQSTFTFCHCDAPPYDLGALPRFTGGVEAVGGHNTAMFTVKQQMYQIRGSSTNPEATALTEVKEGVKNMFMCLLMPSMGHTSIHLVQSDDRQSEPDMTMYVQPLVDGVLQAPDGRPLLPVVMVDHTLARALVDGGKQSIDQALEDFQRAVNRHSELDRRNDRGGFPSRNRQYKCTHPDELPLLRRWLWRNAQRTVPNAWQLSMLPQGGRFNDPSRSPWFATFITHIYAEHTGADGKASPAEELMQRPQPPSASGGGGTARAAARQASASTGSGASDMGMAAAAAAGLPPEAARVLDMLVGMSQAGPEGAAAVAQLMSTLDAPGGLGGGAEAEAMIQLLAALGMSPGAGVGGGGGSRPQSGHGGSRSSSGGGGRRSRR